MTSKIFQKDNCFVFTRDEQTISNLSNSDSKSQRINTNLHFKLSNNEIPCESKISNALKHKTVRSTITNQIIDKMEIPEIEDRINQRYRNSTFQIDKTARKSIRTKKGVGSYDLDEKSMQITESLNVIKLNRMNETLKVDRSYDPSTILKKLDNLNLELSELLTKYLSSGILKAEAESSIYKKSFNDDYAKVMLNNHFNISYEQTVSRSKSERKHTKYLPDIEIQNLFKLLSINKKFHLNRFKNNMPFSKKQDIQNISQPLLNFLKLRIGKPLTQEPNDIDMVLRVKSILNPNTHINDDIHGTVFTLK